MNNIKKILPTIIIDTLCVKPIRLKESIFLGDSVQLDIILKENNELKQLNQDCKATILYTTIIDNVVNSIEQKDGFTIDTLTSKITIIPKKNALRLGLNKISIQIYDIDESIGISPILLNVQATTDSEIIDNANDIQSLKDLEDTLLNVGKEIIKLNTDIDGVENRIASAETTIIGTVSTMNTLVNEEIQSTRDKLAFEEARIDQAIEEMDNKLNNKNTEIDNIFLKSIKLEPYVDGNFVSFKSKIINMTAKELVNYSFGYHINGCPYVQSINSQNLGLITFSLEGGLAKIQSSSIFVKTIQGNNVSVTAKFLSNGLSSIDGNEFGYFLKLETSIKSQFISSANCILVPISGGLL